MKALRIDSATAMERLGAAFSAVTPPGTTIFLCGPLGAGKTTWVRGFLRHRRHRGAVKSPTYTLLEPYEFDGQTINHFDFFRIADAREVEAAGLREHFDGEAICLVEWPERAAGALPRADVTVSIAVDGPRRRLRCAGAGPKGRRILAALNGGPAAPGD